MRRVLRQKDLTAQVKRMGTVVCVSAAGLWVYEPDVAPVRHHCRQYRTDGLRRGVLPLRRRHELAKTQIIVHHFLACKIASICLVP